MHFLDDTRPTPAENLAVDETLLLQAESGAGGEVLRLCEWPDRAVVLGSGCRLAEDVIEDRCRADDVPILRRSSGGGTVLLGPGCLLYSLVLRFDRAHALAEILSSYRYILEGVGAALSGPALHIEQEGISDLALDGRKFSGNAQQRKRTHLLHHGTLLYNFDLPRVGCYLRPPPRQPDYRAGRDHLAFLCNLPLSAAAIRQRLRSAWQAEEEGVHWDEEMVQLLVREKYASEAWTRRR